MMAQGSAGVFVLCACALLACAPVVRADTSATPGNTQSVIPKSMTDDLNAGCVSAGQSCSKDFGDAGSVVGTCASAGSCAVSEYTDPDGHVYKFAGTPEVEKLQPQQQDRDTVHSNFCPPGQHAVGTTKDGAPVCVPVDFSAKQAAGQQASGGDSWLSQMFNGDVGQMPSDVGKDPSKDIWESVDAPGLKEGDPASQQDLGAMRAELHPDASSAGASVPGYAPAQDDASTRVPQTGFGASPDTFGTAAVKEDACASWLSWSCVSSLPGKAYDAVTGSGSEKPEQIAEPVTLTPNEKQTALDALDRQRASVQAEFDTAQKRYNDAAIDNEVNGPCVDTGLVRCQFDVAKEQMDSAQRRLADIDAQRTACAGGACPQALTQAVVDSQKGQGVGSSILQSVENWFGSGVTERSAAFKASLQDESASSLGSASHWTQPISTAWNGGLTLLDEVGYATTRFARLGLESVPGSDAIGFQASPEDTLSSAIDPTARTRDVLEATRDASMVWAPLALDASLGTKAIRNLGSFVSDTEGVAQTALREWPAGATMEDIQGVRAGTGNAAATPRDTIPIEASDAAGTRVVRLADEPQIENPTGRAASAETPAAEKPNFVNEYLAYEDTRVSPNTSASRASGGTVEPVRATEPAVVETRPVGEPGAADAVSATTRPGTGAAADAAPSTAVSTPGAATEGPIIATDPAFRVPWKSSDTGTSVPVIPRKLENPYTIPPSMVNRSIAGTVLGLGLGVPGAYLLYDTFAADHPAASTNTSASANSPAVQTPTTPSASPTQTQAQTRTCWDGSVIATSATCPPNGSGPGTTAANRLCGPNETHASSGCIDPSSVWNRDTGGGTSNTRAPATTGFPTNIASSQSGSDICIVSLDPVKYMTRDQTTRAGLPCYSESDLRRFQQSKQQQRTVPQRRAASSPTGSTATQSPAATLPQITAQTTSPIATTTASFATSTVAASVSRPIVTLIANPSSVQKGDVALLSWSSVNAFSCTILAPDDTVLAKGLRGSTSTPRLAATAVFRASCTTLTAATATSGTKVIVR